MGGDRVLEPLGEGKHFGRVLRAGHTRGFGIPEHHHELIPTIASDDVIRFASCV
jgi:hypothetical protein